MKLITLDRLNTFLTKLLFLFATKKELKKAADNQVSESIEPSDGGSNWIEVKTEDLYVGVSESTEQNVLWMEVKDGNT